MTHNPHYPEQRPPAPPPASVTWKVTLADLELLGTTDPQMAAWLELLRSKLLHKQDAEFLRDLDNDLRVLTTTGLPDGDARATRGERLGVEPPNRGLQPLPGHSWMDRMMRDMFGSTQAASDPYSQQMQADARFLRDEREFPDSDIRKWDTNEEDD